MVDLETMGRSGVRADGSRVRGVGRLTIALLFVSLSGIAISLHLPATFGAIAEAQGKGRAGKKKAGQQMAANPVAGKPEPAATASIPVDELSGFLVKPALKALEERKYALAVSLWRGVVAMRGDGDEAAWKLAEAWTLAGQFKAASRVLGYYAGAVKDPVRKQKAQEEMASLDKREQGFAGRFTVTPALNEAKEAFKRGRAAFKSKKYDKAILYFKAGVVMAPDLPGNYRELGESFDKLGQPAEANEFFVRYLRIRPFGKNADDVRKRLAKSKIVGKLTIESALPCDEVWIEGQRVPVKLPVKAHPMAPGTYEMLCFNEKYHHVQYERVEVKQGEAAKIAFNWAVLENKLDPWGRVVIEDARDGKRMMDIGLWPEVGVPVPNDRRALKITMTAGDGTKKKEEFVKLAPGQRYVLKW